MQKLCEHYGYFCFVFPERNHKIQGTESFECQVQGHFMLCEYNWKTDAVI